MRRRHATITHVALVFLPIACGSNEQITDAGSEIDADVGMDAGSEEDVGAQVRCLDAGSCNDGWCTSSLGANVPLSGVWGRSADDVWVIGEHGNIFHWDGCTWSPSKSNTSSYLLYVTGSVPNAGWVLGYAESGQSSGTLHWNGSGWALSSDGPRPCFDLGCYPYGIWSTGANDVLVASGGRCPKAC
jgi:hypothetical protein